MEGYTLLLIAGSILLWLPNLILMLRYIFRVLPWRLAEVKVISRVHAAVQYRELFCEAEDDADGQGFEVREFKKIHAPGNYAVPLILLLVLAGFAILTGALWVDAHLSGGGGRIQKLPLEVVMALAGAHAWSVYEVHHRARSRDLTPEDLYEVALRFVVAVPVGYAGSLLIVDTADVAFAFAISAFPMRDIRLFVRQRLLKRYSLAQDSGEGRSAEGHLGRAIQGMGDETLARLQELNIATYLDMAYADPVRLMANTGFTLRLVMSWIDQSLLRVYAGENTTKLWRLGVPCALDAYEYYQDHFYDKEKNQPRAWESDPAVADLAAELKVPKTTLQEMFKRVYADPHVQFLAKLWYPNV